VHDRGSLSVLTGALLLVWGLAGAEGEPAVVVFSGPTMGTRYTVRVVAPPVGDSERARIQAVIDAELGIADRLLSTWDPESELSRFNDHASTEPFPLAAETVGLLEIARELGDLSGGAFDVTVGPLVQAWGFGPAGPPSRTPSAEDLAEVRARVGQKLLHVDAPTGTVAKGRPDVACDLSALAPGWTADRIAAGLVALGHHRFVVDIGGEVVARGRRVDGTRWRVAVESPGRPRESALVLALENTAVATSGDYRNAWVDEEGRRRSHLIDPRTGEPVTHGLASVTVVHPEGVWADGLATALLVMGPEPAWALATDRGLAVRLVARAADGTYSAATTPEFEALVWPGPTE
jgi:thiamine biosynthesis lipoprotein